MRRWRGITRSRHSTAAVIIPMSTAPQSQKLSGDRNGDVSALERRHWDAVIDTCGYVPSGIERVMNALDRERVAHYTFVSSYLGVSQIFRWAGLTRARRSATITPEQLSDAERMATGPRATARTYGEMYGALKVLCEQAAEQAMPGRVLSVRPGLIVGAHDYTDRFTYWVRRVATGGDVLAPDGRSAVFASSMFAISPSG